jgi:hypothetical protein
VLGVRMKDVISNIDLDSDKGGRRV